MAGRSYGVLVEHHGRLVDHGVLVEHHGRLVDHMECW